jgi:urea transport system permease protein
VIAISNIFRRTRQGRRKLLLFLRHLVFAIALLFVLAPLPAGAGEVDRTALVAELCGNADAMAAGGAALLAMSNATDVADLVWARPLVSAILNRQLACRADGSGASIISATGSSTDAVSGASSAIADDSRKPVLGLKNRSVFELADAALTLRTSGAVGERGRALHLIERRVALLPDGVLDKAAASETDPGLHDQIRALGQAAALGSPDPAKRIAAIGSLAETPNRRVLTQLETLRKDHAYAADPVFAAAVDRAIGKVARVITLGDILAAGYNGLSYASILFMAAIGLAIIFGLMGVINLAQGELIMIGAYVTWLVQEGLHRFAPWLIDYYLILAIVPAFLGTAGIGIALEAILLRHLYRRPLMSLLATWAVSLFLMNLVRVIFGTQTLQFETPFYITGGVPLVGDFIFTWNRMFAIAFALATLAVTWLLVRATPLGLNIRAVTQNRDMAGCIGIRTRRVDMLAFGLGSGLAGLAGLALSPIYSINPQMGQNFIVDSFMVVVLGGVGTIAGTLAAAFGIGQINVLIEPLYGAVAAKVIVLTLIIFFLQWRPEGLFAVKGRRK